MNSSSEPNLLNGKETDLILLDSAPKKPLIRALYLEESTPRKRSWWRFL